ncbi:MAG: hypothetical protein ACREHG_03195, partial [Candidatus Saccharimonadales bacterium]
MAAILVEGFDTYGPNPGASSPNYGILFETAGWTYINIYSGVGIASTLNGNTGYSITLPGVSAIPGNGISRTLAKGYSRLIGGVRFNSSLLSDTSQIVFSDSNTAQCSLTIQPTSGFITINEGFAGTILQQSTASVAGNTTHYLEWDITFGIGVYGGWTVWLDGVQITAGTGTTQQSVNASANMLQLHTYGPTISFDDLYLFDDTTLFNNTALLSNPIVITQQPIGDEQTQFANNGNVVGYTYSMGDT